MTTVQLNDAGPLRLHMDDSAPERSAEATGTPIEDAAPSRDQPKGYREWKREMVNSLTAAMDEAIDEAHNKSRYVESAAAIRDLAQIAFDIARWEPSQELRRNGNPVTNQHDWTSLESAMGRARDAIRDIFKAQ